jgi:predicted HAD superfamily Cof-like phosphohydrolase
MEHQAISCVQPSVNQSLPCVRESDSEKVKTFTEASTGNPCPSAPQVMSGEEVRFIIRMIQSELCELAQTVTKDHSEAIDMLHDCIGVDTKSGYSPPEDQASLMADQYDAFVDIWYYSLNCACKKGVDLSAIFKVVHEANMAKVFPDGTFHRRCDGKVIKPDGWREPDIRGEIVRQTRGL